MQILKLMVTNGDGTDSDDEFIEFYNTGSTDFDLSGYTISDETGERHVFDQGTVIPANSFLVVFGGGTPTGFDAGVAYTASSSSLSLNNGGDTIYLKNASGGC